MVLINDQKEIVENIYNNLNSHCLHNIPTGKGKTFILLALALKAFKELGKKVIISTSTNQLVKEFMTVAQNYNFGIDKEDIEIQIGKDNYIEYSSYLFSLESGELEQYITKESLEKYNKFIKQNNNHENLFFMDFNEIVVYKDIAYEETVKKILRRASNINNKEIFQSNITITNHFFFITSTVNTKSLHLEEYVVLFDEVHLMGEVAEATLSNKFSIFGTKIDADRLKKSVQEQEDFVGKQAMLKNIDIFRVALNKTFLSFSNKDKTGVIEDKTTKANFLNVVSNIISKESTEKLIKQISKNSKNPNLSISSASTDLLFSLKEFKSIYNSFKVSEDFVSMTYTPSLGYPVVSSFRENPLGMLNKKIWSKLKYFSGVSATISPSFSPNNKELNYALKRLGMLRSDADMSIKFYEKFFPKDLIEIYLPEEKIPDYHNVHDEKFEIKNSEYHKYIVEYIHNNHHNKNSIIFCGGYKEAEVLSSLYASLYKDMNILKANKKQKSHQTINDFKKQGGLLFATRDYGIGISLKGKLLENLFLLRLPYPIIGSFKWETLKKRNQNTFFANMNYEMLISLMQVLGRLQRSKTDKGSIFLLDKRYNRNIQLKNRINEVLEFYGNIKTIKEKEYQENKKLEDKISISNEILSKLIDI